MTTAKQPGPSIEAVKEAKTRTGNSRTAKTAAKPSPAPRYPDITLQYREDLVPAGTQLRMPCYRDTPEVQVLSVDRVEGQGEAVWYDRYRYCLIWR